MSSYTDVKNLIISSIKTNGRRQITGQILQDVLLAMLENSSQVEEITYSDLKALRDEAKLTPSTLYRITDYITTTTQADTQSAGNAFDIIVLALSESVLSEQAWAVQSARDTDGYFANSKLSAWKIWYCLDNDTSRFAWADTANGRGVIYRMVDEFNNDCPYDFKNIQFYSDNSVKFTFCGISGEDDSLYGCRNNVISPTFQAGKMEIGYNLFGHNVSDNLIRVSSIRNTFGNYCTGNFIDESCNYNSFGDNCNQNRLVCACNYNTFGSGCRGNILNLCDSTTFDKNCLFNMLNQGCYSNNFGSNCNFNSLGANCHNNVFGSYFNSNHLGHSCTSVTFGSSCLYNELGNGCSVIVCRNSCSRNSFGNFCNSINLALNFCRDNIFDDGVGVGLSITNNATASINQQVQNYHFTRGVNNQTIEVERNRAYETTVAKDSSGKTTQFCIADMVDALSQITIKVDE